MANAMVALANITLGSSAATVTFGSIPATYRDLRLVIGGSTSASAAFYIRLNADSGTNYNDVAMYGDGTTAGSNSRSNNSSGYIGIADTAINTTTVDVMDYSATDKHKSWLSRGNAAGTRTESRAGRWANTAAVTSLMVATDTGTLTVGTVISLYGILA